MARITVRQKGILAQCARDWPLFYMNDFSRFGLLVDDLHQADRVLALAGYSTEPGEHEIYVQVEGHPPAQVVKIVELLQGQGLEAATADLISCVYQG